MAKVKLTVTESACRCGYLKTGDTFTVEDICPPVCAELWHITYPYVFALQSGGTLDCGEAQSKSFDIACTDGGRVRLHGEITED